MTASDTGEGSRVRARRLLRIHFACFATVVIVLAAIDLGFFETRWFHWPAMVWGALFCVHFLYCKSHAVDDDWVEKRTSRIRINSYDLGHIQSIEDSYKKDSPPDDSGADDRK